MKNKLYRTDGYIGGVCQGIADNTNTSAIAWRLIFIIIPCGFWAYMILWLLLKKQTKSFRGE
jgi:phage shock protein PspC (stress-responsive transcriptional regulator)